MRLRPAVAADAEALAAVHAAAFDVAWSAHEIGSFLAGPGGFAFAAEDEGVLTAFIQCRAIVDEAEVLTLAVAPASRRVGLARALLETAAAAAMAKGAARLFLEVAADNASAIALYQSAGFTELGRRAGYYQGPVGHTRDALVMGRDLNR